MKKNILFIVHGTNETDEDLNFFFSRHHGKLGNFFSKKDIYIYIYLNKVRWELSTQKMD